MRDGYKLDSFILGKGIDLTSPTLVIQPGRAYVAVNYELGQVAGYRRMRGYERFDGRPSPSGTDDLEEREVRRAAIQVVPGSGPVRGAFYIKGFRYAFRNNVAGTALVLHRATATGWVEVTTPVLAPGGRLRWIRHNFGGGSTTEAVYGVTGTNKAFQFDGTTYTEITTGAEPLFPTEIEEFANHLALGYLEGSVQFSAPAEPLNYATIDGAVEVGIGYPVYGLLSMIGGALAVFSKEKIDLIVGSSALDFAKRPYSDVGVKQNTVQPLFSDAVFLDKQIQIMSSAESFGDFQSGTLSEPIRPLIERFLGQPLISTISKRKNQYTIFNNEREAIVTSFNNGRLEGFTTYLLLHDFFDVFTTENDEGQEEVYAAGEDGFVYSLDTGSSFDGQAIRSFLLLAPNHTKAYERRKRFRRVIVESDAAAFSALNLLAEYDYGASPRSLSTTFITNPKGGLLNNINWNQFFWSSDLKGYATTKIEGHGRNILLFIFNESNQDTEFTLESVSIGYSLRGQLR